MPRNTNTWRVFRFDELSEKIIFKVLNDLNDFKDSNDPNDFKDFK